MKVIEAKTNNILQIGSFLILWSCKTIMTEITTITTIIIKLGKLNKCIILISITQKSKLNRKLVKCQYQYPS